MKKYGGVFSGRRVVARILKSMNDTQNLSPESFVVSAGRPAPEHDAPVNPPVVFSSTFRGAGTVNTQQDKVYARFYNPTWNGFEDVVAGLEGAQQPGLVFASGMAAIASVMNLVPVGSTIFVPKHAYMASITIAQDLQRRGIATVIRIDLEDTEATLHQLREVAREQKLSPEIVDFSAPKALLWLESPTNPMLEVADLKSLLAEARALGIVSAVDNTFATPIAQQPLALGADIVVHSATKALAGHSDVLMGITVTCS